MLRSDPAHKVVNATLYRLEEARACWSQVTAPVLWVDAAESETLKRVGLTPAMVDSMYHVMAIANYEDRFVIPSTHREYAENAFNVRGGCGFSFGNGCSEGVTETSLFGSEKKRTIPIKASV